MSFDCTTLPCLIHGSYASDLMEAGPLSYPCLYLPMFVSGSGSGSGVGDDDDDGITFGRMTIISKRKTIRY